MLIVAASCRLLEVLMFDWMVAPHVKTRMTKSAEVKEEDSAILTRERASAMAFERGHDRARSVQVNVPGWRLLHAIVWRGNAV